MKKLKALLCIVLVLATALGLSGCFKSTKNAATFMHNGKELTSKDFDEVTIVEWNSTDNTTISATIDVKALGCDIQSLYSYRCYLGKDKSKDSTDDYVFYNKTYNIEVDEIEYLYYDEDADEIIDDGISYYCGEYYIQAIKEFDSNDELGIMVEASFDSNTQTFDDVKKEILKIFDHITVDDDADEEDATVARIDAVKFDNGWFVTDITDVDFYSDCVSFTCVDDDDNNVYFNVEPCTQEEYDSRSDGSIFDNIEKVKNEKGKEIGFMLYDDDSYSCYYYINTGSNNYYEVMVSCYADDSNVDVYSWNDIDAFLNSGNKK